MAFLALFETLAALAAFDRLDALEALDGVDAFDTPAAVEDLLALADATVGCNVSAVHDNFKTPGAAPIATFLRASGSRAMNETRKILGLV